MPVEEVARTMEVPPGFKWQVFAAEQDVPQLIAMAWDARGRLWVADCGTYGRNFARWNNELRDCILTFEDTDSDGHGDKRTVSGIRGGLTSIAIGDGGVYLYYQTRSKRLADVELSLQTISILQQNRIP